jgi:hypothetical protein
MDKNKCPKLKIQNTFGKIKSTFYIINSQNNLKNDNIFNIKTSLKPIYIIYTNVILYSLQKNI